MGRKNGNGRKRRRGPMGRPQYKPVDEQLWRSYPELRPMLSRPAPKGPKRSSSSVSRREVPPGASPVEGPGEDSCS